MKMWIQISIYAIIILVYVFFNFFAKNVDSRTGTAINILITSVLFGFVSLMAFIFLKKTKNKK